MTLPDDTPRSSPSTQLFLHRSLAQITVRHRKTRLPGQARDGETELLLDKVLSLSILINTVSNNITLLPQNNWLLLNELITTFLLEGFLNGTTRFSLGKSDNGRNSKWREDPG